MTTMSVLVLLFWWELSSPPSRMTRTMTMKRKESKRRWISSKRVAKFFSSLLWCQHCALKKKMRMAGPFSCGVGGHDKRGECLAPKRVVRKRENEGTLPEIETFCDAWCSTWPSDPSQRMVVWERDDGLVPSSCSCRRCSCRRPLWSWRRRRGCHQYCPC